LILEYHVGFPVENAQKIFCKQKRFITIDKSITCVIMTLMVSCSIGRFDCLSVKNHYSAS